MTRKVITLCILAFFVIFVIGQDADCSAVGIDDVGVDDFIDHGGPSHILYVIVCQVKKDSGCYYNQMIVAGALLTRYINEELPSTGSTFRMAELNGDGFVDASTGSVFTPEWSKYTQVWVGDLSSSLDDISAMVSGFNDIINWYKNRGDPHIICDGRILSSLWAADRGFWNSPRPNYGLVRNYAANLRVRGGGLVLSTDHAKSFTEGINQINQGISIKPFVGFFYQEPFMMEVDTDSTIWTYPDRGYWIQSELEKPGASGNKTLSYWYPGDLDSMGWIFDDSSTSDAPFNEQPNGRILYPVSWHQGYLNERPGVSSTISGKVGFLIGIQSPSCDDHFEGVQTIQFDVDVLKGGDGGAVVFQWISSVDGILQTETTSETFSKPASEFSPGEHVITCRAKDIQGLIAEARVRIRIIFLSHNDVCFAAGWNGGKSPQEIFPLKQGGSAVDFYSYGVPISGASNTGLELPRVGQWYFYENSDGTLSLVANFGSGVYSSSISHARATITVTGYDTADVKLEQRDSQFDVAKYIWQPNSATGTFQFDFGISTAGVVLGPFKKTPFCVTITLDKAYQDNVNYFYVRSHSLPSQVSQAVNPSKIVHYSSPGISTNDIKLCYGQCVCPEAIYNDLTNSLNNRGLNFLLGTSTLGHYTDIHTCSWDIRPSISDDIWGISIYFDTNFGISAGDVLSIFEDDSGIPSSTFEGTATPVDFHADDISSLQVVFTPTNDGNTNVGFSATYWVLPQLNHTYPSQVPSTETTTVTFHGKHFVDSPSLKCKIDDVEYPATFVSSTEITCAALPHAIGLVNVEVSNDGRRFTITDGLIKPIVQLEYYNADCQDLSTCGACVQDVTCTWCNIDQQNSYCFSGSGQCEGVDDLPETECTSCYGLNSCDNFEGGTCNPDDTCTCNPDRFDNPPDCSCKKCPISNGEYCGGVLENGRLVGECGCDGICQCADGFSGDDCSCIDCGGWNGRTCGGVGTCQCDGNCTCDDGYSSLTEQTQICECSETCPTSDSSLECSGHGSCQCGTCDCDDGWTLLPDCSCASSCEDDCNGNGICSCSGDCVCSAGFFGDTCQEAYNCTVSDCNSCTADNGCAWCPVTSSCVHPSEFRSSECSQSELMKEAGSCPELIIQEVDTPNYVTTGIAIAVGGVLALISAVVAAVLIAKSESESDILNYGTNPFAAGNGAMESSLYQSAGNGGQSALYQSKS